ncbi:unnamed protein product [Zymoseptoria tritici ST99CH_1A5]|uniref:Uncharacterized protein n=2 Tax=Zymoseptoria tritici TaxID=1047171 RepID=A0A2H1FJC1_ZYMTR|nr:unnamed protein product [Zymoseptoria tritici ST99CH_1E4]SMY18773.1 unnamed protein product [Zymoseptoria tritici ST99CH_1A5]
MSSKDSKHSKHIYIGHPSTAASIPRPPPLPPPRPLQRARDAASRFLGYSSRSTSPHHDNVDDRLSLNSIQFTRSASLGATQNATASHRTGLEIRTISINDTGTHALIAGKEIFKTVKIEDGTCAEDFNLRTAIRSTPNHASGKPRQIYSIDIADVAWAKGDSGNYIAAATSSGKIILYDLGHAGLQAAQLHEHFRQVHNITFNPHKGSLLLSGSLDGTVRLWDVRDVRTQANAIQSKRKFSGQSDGVRDVKWSPTDGVDFAFGTDNGEIQRWDMRNLKSAKVRIPAHSLSCNTIDWHPDGKHIVSAGSDKILRVFDVSANRPRKAAWEIKTPYPAMNARWRPSCRSAMQHDNGARLCTQIVTAYDREHPVMHIWDFRRPLLPFREIQPYASAPTDMLWHSQDLLWTVGREGTLLQTDIQHSAKVIDRYNLQAFDVSPLGEVSIVTQGRKVRRVPKQIPSFTNGSLGSSPEKNYGLSRSWADDSIDHAFLSILPLKGQNRSSSTSRAHAASNTSTSSQSQTATLKLDEILLNRKSYRPQQVACRGLLPGHNSHQYVAWMAERCKTSIEAASNDEDVRRAARETFQANAGHALSAGFWSLSQTWKIVGLMTDNHLRDRAALKRKRASAKAPQQIDEALMNLSTSMDRLARTIAAQHAKSEAASPNSLRPVSTIAQQLAVPESTSNVPTPLARASSPSQDPGSHHRVQLPEFEKDDKLALPPSLTRTHSPPKVGGTAERRLTVGNLTDHVKNQLGGEASHRRDRLSRWSTQSKEPLSLDPVDKHGMRIPIARLEKHDSAESFKFLEDSAGSREPSFPASLESSRSGDFRMVAERPSRRKPPPTSYAQIDVPSTANQSMFFEGSGTLGYSGVATMESSMHLDMSPMNDETEDVPAEEQKTAGFPFLNAPAIDLPPSSSAPPAAPIPIRKTPFSSSRLEESVSPTSNGLRPPIPQEIQRPHSSIPFSSMEHTELQTQVHEPTFTEADIEIEEGHAVFTLIEMLHKLLEHYTISQPYPQVASHLVLLLGPLLPRTHPLPTPEINQTITHYADHFLASLNTEPDALPDLIQTSFSHTLKSGLQPLQVEAILSAYHDQLLSHRLFDAAASLRRIAYPAYPAVYEDFLKDNTVHVKCGHCGKPMTGDVALLKCESCSRKQNPCVYCCMPSSPFGPSRILSACLLCGHGGHAGCLEEWFLAVGGVGCPTEGCLCDCVGGTWREEKLAFGEKQKEEGKKVEVKRDEWKAKESRAVVGARNQLKK